MIRGGYVGKFDLNVDSVNIYGIDKDSDFIDISVMSDSLKEIVCQLDVVRLSLLNLSSLLNQSVNKGFIKGSRVDIFRGWAKRCKSLSSSTVKCRDNFYRSYMTDSQDYRMRVIDDRLSTIIDNK